MEIGLWYLCAVTGAGLIFCSLILISKRIILVDANTGQVTTEITLPFITLKTNLPVMVMLLFGVLLLAFPIWQVYEDRRLARETNLRRIYLRGKVYHPGNLVKVYALAGPEKDIEGGEKESEFSLEVPLSQCVYRVEYWNWNKTRRFHSEDVELTGEETQHKELRGYRDPGTSGIQATQSQIKESRKEDPKVVSEFK